jgi:16S rRNA (cytidine1402-2'-O)-methyltransferase
LFEEKNIIENALYLVPTPIGNLEDITLRAIKILSKVDLIACEDTRNAGNLLKQLDIHYKKLISYHNFNESEKSTTIINSILEGNSVALISDAGTPGISDPGYRLVSEAIKNNIKIVPLPGASALLPALTASGFPVHKFTFAGFPPHKKGRKTFINSLKSYDSTIILYESPNRLHKLIDEIIEVFGIEIELCIAREISKIFEEFLRGNVLTIKKIIDERQSIKGEIVVIFNPKLLVE